MRVLFIGTGEIGVPVLRWLLESDEHELVGVVTQPDKPVGRAQRIEAPPIKAALGREQVADPSTGPDQARRGRRGNTRARAGCDRRDGLRTNPSALGSGDSADRLPEFARVASAKAPRRGADPGGDRRGRPRNRHQVMYMDEGLDTGDVLLQKRLEIAPDETGGSLHDRLAQIAPDALHEALAPASGGDGAPRSPGFGSRDLCAQARTRTWPNRLDANRRQ